MKNSIDIKFGGYFKDLPITRIEEIEIGALKISRPTKEYCPSLFFTIDNKMPLSKKQLVEEFKNFLKGIIIQDLNPYGYNSLYGTIDPEELFNEEIILLNK